MGIYNIFSRYHFLCIQRFFWMFPFCLNTFNLLDIFDTPWIFPIFFIYLTYSFLRYWYYALGAEKLISRHNAHPFEGNKHHLRSSVALLFVLSLLWAPTTNHMDSKVITECRYWDILYYKMGTLKKYCIYRNKSDISRKC